MGVFEIGRAIWGRFAATAHARVHKIKKIKFKKGKSGAMGLPKFSRHQQLRFVGYLRRRKPYRKISQLFQKRYPEFVPAGMDQEAYEEAFIKRAKDYVSNRRRKWATIIRIGRRREYKRGKRALRERIRQLAWEGAFDVHNEQKKKLPRFTKKQQRFVVANLIAMTPHRKIARNVQILFPEFVPEGNVRISLPIDTSCLRSASFSACTCPLFVPDEKAATLSEYRTASVLHL